MLVTSSSRSLVLCSRWARGQQQTKEGNSLHSLGVPTSGGHWEQVNLAAAPEVPQKNWRAVWLMWAGEASAHEVAFEQTGRGRRERSCRCQRKEPSRPTERQVRRSLSEEMPGVSEGHLECPWLEGKETEGEQARSWSGRQALPLGEMEVIGGSGAEVGHCLPC